VNALASSTYRLDDITEVDAAAMRGLFADVFGKPMSAAFRQWKYRPGAGHGIGVWQGNALVAHYGGVGADIVIDWTDLRLGPQQQNITRTVGDFVLHRADGLWAYQLAVVVDDGEQGITDVVRGEDLADNTARQIHLQRLLGLPTPRYLHTPLVRDARGEKLSKQHGAPALDTREPVAALQAAAVELGLPAPRADTPADALQRLVPAWAARWVA